MYGYDGNRQRELVATVRDRLKRTPGIEGAAVANSIPLERLMNAVSPDYFRTLGVRIVAGRDFTAADGPDAASVAILNEAASAKFFGTLAPLGRTITFLWKEFTVVGVVRDTKYSALTDKDVPVVFVPVLQEAGTGASRLVVRTTDPIHGEAALRRELAAFDRSPPIQRVQRVALQLNDVMTSQRLGVTLLSIFGAVALAICASASMASSRSSSSSGRPRSVFASCSEPAPRGSRGWW